MKNRSGLVLSSNQRAILELLRDHDGSSRAELSVRTGLSPGALSRHIKEMLALSLVEEGVRRSGQRGQPALPISIRPDAAYSIGIAFSLHEIEVVGINFRGEKVAGLIAPLRAPSAAELTAQCSALVRELEATLPVSDRPILGVGIAMPGYFRPGRTVVMETFDALVELAGVDLSIFLSAFNRPTWVENNSSAAALAEYYCRVDHSIRNLVLINIGYGFSAGYIVDGKLYRGRNGNAGEVGRLYPRGTPRPSAIDLVNTLRAHDRPMSGMVDIERAIKRADRVLSQWVARAGEQLCHVVALLDYIFDPDEIVLGGQIPGALCAQLGEVVEVWCQQQPRRPRFRVSALGPQASAIGAAFLPIYQASSPQLRQRR